MNSIKSFLFSFLLGMAGFSSYAQDAAAIEIKIEPVAGEVYVLFGSGGNIGISAGDDGVLIIDSQFGELAGRIREEIAKINNGEIKYLLNTNWHYDHVRGNEAFAMDGVTIIAHRMTRERMMAEQRHESMNIDVPVYPAKSLPTILIDQTLTMHFNGDEIEIKHIGNAHSDADLIFIFKNANVIHSGDLCFNGGYPFIDVPHGGSIDGMIDAADGIISLMDKDTRLIPGHGDIMDINDIRSYRKMLKSIRDKVAGLIKAGKTLEEVIAAKPTAEFDSSMTRWVPADNFVRIVFSDLSSKL